MSASSTRRAFLVGTGAIGAVVFSRRGLGNESAAAETTTLEGRLRYPGDGNGADESVRIVGSEEEYRVSPDDDGAFVESVPADGTYTVVHDTTGDPEASVEDGLPHLYTLETVDLETDDPALGELSVPEGHRVTVLVLDDGDDPEAGAVPDISHRSIGIDRDALTLSDEGALRLRDADTDGVNLAGQVELSLFDGSFTRTLTVTEPLTVRITADAETETVRSYEVSFGDNGDVDDGEPGSSDEAGADHDGSVEDGEESEIDGNESVVDGNESIDGDESSDGRTDGPTGDDWRDDEPTERERPPTEEPNRGFFTNGGDEPVELLNDPFFLTVSGFLMSVGSILYQLTNGD